MWPNEGIATTRTLVSSWGIHFPFVKSPRLLSGEDAVSFSWSKPEQPRACARKSQPESTFGISATLEDDRLASGHISLQR
jgi:hypothetical protein